MGNENKHLESNDNSIGLANFATEESYSKEYKISTS